MHMGEVIRSNTCLILWKDHVFSKTTQVCLLSKPNQSMSENFKETKIIRDLTVRFHQSAYSWVPIEPLS